MTPNASMTVNASSNSTAAPSTDMITGTQAMTGDTTVQPQDAQDAPDARPDSTSANPDELRSAVVGGAVTATYTVQRGDTLGSIAAATGASVAELQRMNGMGRSTALQVGQSLNIPRGAQPSPFVRP